VENRNELRFLGEFEHSLDSANRLMIPLPWRNGERERFILMPDAQEHAIRAVPDKECL